MCPKKHTDSFVFFICSVPDYPRGRSIALDFLRLPSKRQFPDYYQVIKKPIALEDIQKQLEDLEYSSLEELREDFETCFKNAKKYNVRESVIWKDAKSLQVLRETCNSNNSNLSCIFSLRN